jgi:voltage-gated potassium channel Kch
MVAQVEDPVPSLREAAPDVPAAMDDVVTRALAKAADDRFASAGDLARAARAAITGARPREGALAASRTTDWEGHVIVAGLGKGGLRLARGLNDAGFRVVAIEDDETRAPIARLREDGIHVFIGDAADPELLHEARVALAQHVVVSVGDDLSNLNIANVVERERGADQPNVLTVFVHVDDPTLLRTLTADAVQRLGPRDTRLEFFNARAAGARLLLARHPPIEDGEAQLMTAPRVLVVGQGSIATELSMSIAAEWQVRRPTAGKLPLMIIGPTADADVRELLSGYPRLADLCDLEATDADARSARFQSGEVLLNREGESTIAIAYIAFDD